MGLGYQALLEDLGITADLRVWTDSSAAIGIAGRQGLGKLRHLDTHTLWLQQAVRSKRIQLKKVPGESNPADIFTKHSLTRDKMMQLVKLFDCRFADGRATSAPALRKGTSTKTTMASFAKDINVVQPAEPESSEPIVEFTPVIPHTQMERQQLDSEYPSLEAPPEVDNQVPEPEDLLLGAGMRVADQITVAMRLHGRTKQDLTNCPANFSGRRRVGGP